MTEWEWKVLPLGRRELFAWAGVLGGATLLGACTGSPSEGPATPFRPEQFDPPMGGSFTLQERDRRWSSVRRIMARPPWQLQAILCPSSAPSYGRYLSQAGGWGGGGEVLFPASPQLPVILLAGSSRAAHFWNRFLRDWSGDGNLLVQEGGGPEAVANLLREWGLERPGTRVGVAQLQGSRFDPEGTLPATYLEKLRRALPQVSFHPIDQWGQESGPVEETAMVKSGEEQEVVRRCSRAGERALQELRHWGRPGRLHAHLWFRTYATLLQSTGEPPTRLSISLNARANTSMASPLPDLLQEGDIIAEEIAATVRGYQAQVNHSIFVGSPSSPGYSYYKQAMETVVQIFENSLSRIVPGRSTFGELVDAYAEAVEEAGAEDVSGVVVHSSGLGSLSRPRLGPTNSPGDREIVIRPGMTFNFKPDIRLRRSLARDRGEENRSVQIGEHILITESGYQRLGRRPLEPVTTR